VVAVVVVVLLWRWVERASACVSDGEVGVRWGASEAAASREGRRDYSCDGDMERRRSRVVR
jgi:hypothetical protein